VVGGACRAGSAALGAGGNPDGDLAPAHSAQVDDCGQEDRWQKARKLSDEYARDREKFDADDRLYLEAGEDLVATVEHRAREAELAHARARTEREAAAEERHEAERRSKARQRKGS
jgi:hypothetical protein